MKKYSTLILLILAFASTATAQDRKTLKAHKISQRVETVINYEDGLNNKRVDVEQSFDKKGRLLEYKEFSKDGKIKEWTKYTYTEDGDIASEETINAKGKMDERIVYTYVNGLKTKKSYYDSKERLVKEKFYEYQYFE